MGQERIRKNLEITVALDQSGDRPKSIITNQYTCYPLRLSTAFRLDKDDPQRAYLYMTNTSPGILAGDHWRFQMKLEAGTSLHITDQSATKVHAMPIEGTKAKISSDIQINQGASLEFIPEPLILFAESSLEQNTRIQLHPEADLFWSEIILPGRIARGEYYDFNYCFNRVEIRSDDNKLLFRDAMHLEGKDNLFQQNPLFSSKTVMANFIIIQPQLDLEILGKKLEDLEAAHCPDLVMSSSVLPYEKGLLVRALADKTLELKKYLHYALNCVRTLGDHPRLPYIAK